VHAGRRELGRIVEEGSKVVLAVTGDWPHENRGSYDGQLASDVREHGLRNQSLVLRWRVLNRPIELGTETIHISAHRQKLGSHAVRAGIDYVRRTALRVRSLDLPYDGHEWLGIDSQQVATTRRCSTDLLIPDTGGGHHRPARRAQREYGENLG